MAPTSPPETGAQWRQSLLLLEPDAHRYSLRDLDPVAGGVLCRYDRKLSAGGRTQAVHHPRPGLVGIGVDMDGNRLADMDTGEVGFGKVA